MKRASAVSLRFASGLGLVVLLLTGQLSVVAGQPSPSRAHPDQEEACALLGNASLRRSMSTAFELKLSALCYGAVDSDSEADLPMALQSGGPRAPTPAPQGAGRDVRLNDPALDTRGTTQSETSIVAVGDVVCAAWNDTGEGVGVRGLSGFGFSSDGGVTWTDGGPFLGIRGDTNAGKPSLAYSLRDGAFYYAALSTIGLSLWRSDDDCQSFRYIGRISGGFDDKQLMTIDNTPTSPYFGRIYVGWTDFQRRVDLNVAAYSDDGGENWGPEVPMPGSGIDGQGMWPAVAPNGDIYFALVDLGVELVSQWIYRSTDGGDSWMRMTDIATEVRMPLDEDASRSCGRPALTADIRHLPLPQIAISPSAKAPAGYIIHAVYPYDSDDLGPDDADVFYRRSLDGALSWAPELRINDDTTATDQFMPALAVSPDGVVGISWYDRRHDPNNVHFDRYFAASIDEGRGFGANERLSDQSSPVAQTNPNFDVLATCYHGDYDQLAYSKERFHVVWSDDRRITETGPNPDVYYEQIKVNPSAGSVGASRAIVGCRSTFEARVVDADLVGAGKAVVGLEASSGDREGFFLTEGKGANGTFTQQIDVVDSSVRVYNEVVEAGHGDTVTVTYKDDDVGNGSSAVDTATVRLDCVAPAIENVRAEDVIAESATIRLDVSETSDVEVQFGTACTPGQFEDRATSAMPARTSSVQLKGLAPSTLYFYAVIATDVAGNAVVDDNEGECYNLLTQTLVLAEDFESTPDQYVVEGGLWGRTTGCSAPLPGHSAPTSLYFGIEETCNYETGTATTGVVRFAPVQVETANGATLSFNYFLEKENFAVFDRATAEIRVNGGPPIVVAASFASPAFLRANTGVWQAVSVSLDRFLGDQPLSTIELLFRFDTVDPFTNFFEGFHVDDVRIISMTPPT